MKKADSNLKLLHLCQLMNVPIASYYYRSIDKPETAQYLEALTVIHKENFQVYGRRRMKVVNSSSKCNTLSFKKDFVRCSEIQTLLGLVIQFLNCLLDDPITYLVKVTSFRKESSQQTIGIFI